MASETSDYSPDVSFIGNQNEYLERWYQEGAISPDMNVFYLPIDRFVDRRSSKARELTGEKPENLPNIIYARPDLTPYEGRKESPASYSGSGTKKRKSGVEKHRDIESHGILKTGEIEWDNAESLLIADGRQDVLEDSTIVVKARPSIFN